MSKNAKFYIRNTRHNQSRFVIFFRKPLETAHGVRYKVAVSISKHNVRTAPIIMQKREYAAARAIARAERRTWSNWAAGVIRAELQKRLGTEWEIGRIEYPKKDS